MMIYLYKVKKKDTQLMSKKNPLKKDLFTKKYKLRIIKAKKGKGSFKRKKNRLIATCWFKY